MSWGHECVRDEKGYCQQCVALGHANYVNPDFAQWSDRVEECRVEVSRLVARMTAMIARHWSAGLRDIRLDRMGNPLPVVDADALRGHRVPSRAVLDEATSIAHALVRAETRYREVHDAGWQSTGPMDDELQKMLLEKVGH